MKLVAFLFACLIAAAVSGCDTKGEPMAFDKVCGLGNDGKTVETKGVLSDKGSVFCSNTSGRMECGFRFSAESGGEGFNADIAIGSGANSMDELSRGYKAEDIVIRGDDGNRIELGKPLTITGKISAYQSSEAPNGIGCFIKVYKIEKK